MLPDLPRRNRRRVRGAFFMAVRLLGQTVVALSVCASVSPHAEAYELRSHAAITAHGFEASRRVADYLQDVGIGPRAVFDAGSATPIDRLAGFVNAGTVRDWAIEGAIREDDYQRHPLLEALGCTPPSNPPSAIDRPLAHFLDVQRGSRGLTVGPAAGLPAVDWALGRQGRGGDATQNQFSLPDARLYQLRSLTEATREARDRNTALLFRALGQVVHLLQDMAQPQHVRNDAHSGCVDVIAGEHSWYEDYVERRALGQGFRRRGEPAPPLGLDGYAPPSLADFRDFFTSPDAAGLADFTSRNFFSAGTNLSLLLGDCGGLAEPPCRRDAYTERDEPFTFTTIDGTAVGGVVRLLLRTMRDPITGALVPDVAVSARSLWDQHLERRGLLPAFTLNAINYDAMSDVLLPRAAGYSAGLLDHFFRGRLDVELLEDPASAEAIRLESRNLSPDTMSDGVLSLHAEQADGTRTRLGDAGAVPDVPPGGALPPLTAPGAPGATRLLAVYHGALGAEVRDDAGGVPGAVIARLVDVPRVEELVSDGGRWHLRTADGVFPLPILAGDIEDLRWGDVDNTLVGRTRLGAGAASLFRAWRINRAVGSTVVPLLPVDAGGVRLVDVAVTQEAAFPFGAPVGTTVAFSGTRRVTQDLVTFDAEQDIVFDPLTGAYRAPGLVEARNAGPARVERVVTDALAVPATFAVTLAADALDAPARRPYAWHVREIGLDARGRMLAVTEVVLTEPEGNTRTVPLKARNVESGELETAREITLRVDFPVATLLFALVDVTAGRVVASTAGPTFAPVSAEAVHQVLFQKHARGTAFGGPRAGTEIEIWDSSVELVPADALPAGFPDAPVLDTAVVQGESGVTAFALPWWYRPEIAALVETPPTVSPRAVAPLSLVYALDRAGDDSIRGYLAVRAEGTVGELDGYVTALRQARRLRPSAAGEQLLVFGRPVGIRVDEGEEGVVVQWRPETAAAALALPFELPPAAEHRLASASSSRALVVSRSELSATTRLVDLDTATAAEFPGEDLSDRFVVLEPTFLYNTGDLRFYRPRTPLRRGALPPRLAGMAGNPVGDYHAILPAPPAPGASTAAGAPEATPSSGLSAR
jgi:hypothetical protein